jgi:hypothetical protein
MKAVPCLGRGLGDIGRIIPCQKRIDGASNEFGDRQSLLLSSLVQPLHLFFRKIEIGSFHVLSR